MRSQDGKGCEVIANLMDCLMEHKRCAEALSVAERLLRLHSQNMRFFYIEKLKILECKLDCFVEMCNEESLREVMRRHRNEMAARVPLPFL